MHYPQVVGEKLGIKKQFIIDYISLKIFSRKMIVDSIPGWLYEDMWVGDRLVKIWMPEKSVWILLIGRIAYRCIFSMWDYDHAVWSNWFVYTEMFCYFLGGKW